MSWQNSWKLDGILMRIRHLVDDYFFSFSFLLCSRRDFRSPLRRSYLWSVAKRVNLKLNYWDDLPTPHSKHRLQMYSRFSADYLQDRFVNRVSNYFLRDSSHKFNVPLPRTNYLKNSVRYSGAVLWNGLPSTLRQAESIHSFKSDCKESLK